MKRNEFMPLIQKFGFISITKNNTQGYRKQNLSDEELDRIKRKFKYKQCYISFEDDDICITFNNPPYTFLTTDISLEEIQSLFYYLTIISNRKFAIKKENPNICNIHQYFEEKTKSFPTMSSREKNRFDLDNIEFNKIKELVSKLIGSNLFVIK